MSFKQNTTRYLAASLSVLTAVLLNACGQENPQARAPQASGETAAPTQAQGPMFVDIATETGLVFRHWNGMMGQGYFVEPVGSGVALADFDNDGDLDIYLVQGSLLAPPGPDKAPVFPVPQEPGGRLFRNDLTRDAEGRPQLRFTDLTDESGIRAFGYGMGAAVGDLDNDGRVDLYLTNFGPNQLWRNRSGGGRIRFEDITEQAGVDDPRWSTSAGFTDVNGDGWLDLFVANYVDFRLDNHRACRSAGGRPDYCGPQSYNGESDRLFLNRGDGRFDDITGPAGLLQEGSSGLGVVATDIDLDGRLDLYVANDLKHNFLWHNQGGDQGIPKFENVALMTGVAVSMEGRVQASMGVVAGDIDNDGDDDLFMTHLNSDNNTLYVNDGQGYFDDRSSATGLAGPSLPATGFGTALIDIENDGWLDLVAANGEVRIIEAQAAAGDPYPLKQANQLFRNRGDGSFDDISDRAGPEFSRLEVSRGIAVGDLDNDGRSDILITNSNGPARLLHNRDSSGNHWIGLRLLTPQGRDALGARITLTKPDGSRLWRRSATDGSYLSASDPRVLIGLGETAQVPDIRVDWLGGGAESWKDLAADRYHTLVMGEGLSIAPE